MNPAYSECRRAVRVRPTTAEVLFDSPSLPDLMRLVDLSTEGALLQGEAVGSVGRPVRMVLLLSDGDRAMVEGRVVRSMSNGEGPMFAVGFERISASAKRLLSDTVTAELKRQLRREQPAALVVGSKTVCRSVCESLSELGAAAHSEGTVLDAITRLVRGEPEFGTVFVGNPVGSATAFEFARFVGTQFPHIRLVLLVESRDQASPLIRHDGRVVTMLDKPWTPTRLASLMLPGAWALDAIAR